MALDFYCFRKWSEMQKKDSKPQKEVDPSRIASLSSITEHSWPIYTAGFKKAADLQDEDALDYLDYINQDKK